MLRSPIPTFSPGPGHPGLGELGRVHVGGATFEGRVHWDQEDGGAVGRNSLEKPPSNTENSGPPVSSMMIFHGFPTQNRDVP